MLHRENVISTYLVNISNASSSYCCLCSAEMLSKVSSLMNAFEHVPKALFALEANAENINMFTDLLQEQISILFILCY